MATLRGDGRYHKILQRNKIIVTGYGSTPEEADEDAKVKLQERMNPSPTITTITCLRDIALVYWFPEVKAKKTPTKKRYLSAFAHISKWFAEMPLEEIDRTHATRLVAELNQRQVNRGGRKSKITNPMAPKTVRFVVSIARSILRIAIDEGYLRKDPFAKVTLPELPDERERVLTPDQAMELFDKLEGTELLGPVFMACSFGLCRGEVCGLRWSDINRRTGQISIDKQLTQHSKDLQGLKTKARKRKEVLPKFYFDMIDRTGNLDHEYVFTYGGDRWRPNELTRQWAKVREDLGLADFTFHDLRHVAAALMYMATQDVLASQKLLGHAKPKMSLLYLKGAEDKRSIDKLSGMFAKDR